MKVSLIVFVALISMGLLRKHSAALRHWVLATAILCAGLTPLLGTIVPAWHVPLPKMTKTVTEAAVSTEEQFSMAAQPSARESALAGTAANLLPAVWLAGTAISLGVLLAGLGRLAWLASRAHRVSGGKWAAALGRVQLLHSDHPTLMVTWGIARPKIIVPSAARDWSDDRLRIVLWHELAHIQRGDWLLQMIAELLRAVYWFNPLLWIACRRLRLESERACDDAVLSCGVEGPEYATELLGLARDLKQRRTWLPAPAMARPSSLERRVSAMLNTSVNRKPMTRLGRVATVAALLMLAIPIASAQNAFSMLSGNVIDTTGGPLPNVVMVTWVARIFSCPAAGAVSRGGCVSARVGAPVARVLRDGVRARTRKNRRPAR
jgi:beta-lactamase regulating signal transducer with metallopeptidase domain